MQVLVLNASKYQKLQKKDSQSHRAHTRLILLVHLSRSRTMQKLKMLNLPKFNFLENSFCVDSKGAGTGTIVPVCLYPTPLLHCNLATWASRCESGIYYDKGTKCNLMTLFKPQQFEIYFQDLLTPKQKILKHFPHWNFYMRQSKNFNISNLWSWNLISVSMHSILPSSPQN